MQSLPPLPEWVKLEHEVAKILTQQEIHGWYFDEESARKLESTLRIEYETITKVLQDRYPYVAARNSLLKEIIKHKDTSKVVHLHD